MSQQAPEKKGLSKALKFWYGFGDFGFTLMTNVETFYFNAFMTNVANFSTALAGTVSTITSTVDACLSWMYGGIINAAKPGKWGRYRSWLIMLPWIVPFIFAFQFLSISENTTVSAIVISVAFILSHIVWNFPMQPMLPWFPLRVAHRKDAQRCPPPVLPGTTCPALCSPMRSWALPPLSLTGWAAPAISTPLPRLPSAL